ncbi:aspartate ammonia-lyase [Klebsiella variicola]|uniref:Aspartate ammonia-lyase n=1 Tax=Klebsiella michiganensis TaxID=1134687 RepID=A0A6P1V5T4_9ENTR|nr:MULTISPECIES: aspartate ammonia-lyase [Klebsiella]MCC5458512.1 aspartate ammonia-lyase [Klebsiella variicola]QHS49775.1 aspartate ammonia-lyase [Klebsiella michiganensis]VUS85892.1 Aspartate ammonia-lyase [Klebsiella pasteurii]HDX8940692.1 aspartate ammonia-lyase [Klebsiella michiganensis]
MNMQTRIEEDLLGFREINDEAFYGIHTLRAAENFRISGVKSSSCPAFICSMVLVKKAVAMANLSLGILPAEIANVIISACDEFIGNEFYLSQFPIDVFQGGAGTSFNMNVNEVIANIALQQKGYSKGRYDIINPNDHVNKSQSTNDAYPTGFRIALYRESERLLEALERLQHGFDLKAAEFSSVLKMGRTQLQDAVPMTLGQEFAAFSTALKEEKKLIRYTTQLLLEVNLGATAIGTGVNTAPGYQQAAVAALAEVTSLPVVASEDLIEATSDCGAYVIIQSAFKRLAIKLSKMCNDLRLLSSGPRAGLNEINLPEKQAGSSIMPGKVNPVIPEVVNQVCFKVIGNDLCVSLASEAGQLQLNVMEPVIGQAMFESITLLTNAMDNLNIDCIHGITANEEICKGYVMNSIGIVTYLNPYIGHHNGDLVGKICRTTGKSVREVIIEKHLMEESLLDQILSVQNLAKPGYPAG